MAPHYARIFEPPNCDADGDVARCADASTWPKSCAEKVQPNGSIRARNQHKLRRNQRLTLEIRRCEVFSAGVGCDSCSVQVELVVKISKLSLLDRQLLVLRHEVIGSEGAI
jgi:hypothetical protein